MFILNFNNCIDYSMVRTEISRNCWHWVTSILLSYLSLYKLGIIFIDLEVGNKFIIYQEIDQLILILLWGGTTRSLVVSLRYLEFIRCKWGRDRIFISILFKYSNLNGIYVNNLIYGFYWFRIFLSNMGILLMLALLLIFIPFKFLNFRFDSIFS